MWCGFFFNDTATTEIYTLSLHDALPISPDGRAVVVEQDRDGDERMRLFLVRLANPGSLEPLTEASPNYYVRGGQVHRDGDRKSTRLNSSHANISYAVFCLKKKQSCLLLL